MSFSNDVAPVLLSLAPLYVPVLLAFLTVFVTNVFARMPASARSVVATIVQTAVNAVEQTAAGKGLTPEEKKALALQFIHDQLAHFKLNVPDSVVIPLLEEAVLILDLAKGDAPVQVPVSAQRSGGSALKAGVVYPLETSK